MIENYEAAFSCFTHEKNTSFRLQSNIPMVCSKHSSLSHDLFGPFFPQGKSCAVYSLPSCHARLQRHTALPDPINGTIRTILWSYQKSEHLLLFLACNLWWVSTDIVTSILALSVNPSYRTFIERVRVVYSYWCCLSD